MSILTHSPAIVRDGLVLCLDAGAVRSYPIFRGSNLITNGEFTTDTTAWAGYGGTTLSRVTASSDPGVPSGGTDDYCLKVNGTYFAYDPISTTTGKHYFVRLRGYDTSGGNTIKISASSDGGSLTGVSEVTVSGAEWKTYTSSFIAEGTTTYIRIGANSGGGSVSYWDKVEVYEAIWADLSGNFNDGVINNIDGLSAESGAGGTKSFYFDGTNDHIDLGSTFEAVLEDSFSICLWVKATDGQPSAKQTVLGTQEGTVDILELDIMTDGKFFFYYESNDNYASAETDNVIFANGQNDWVHVSCTASSGTAGVGGMLVYIDGVLATSGDGDTSSVVFGDYNTTRNIYIGAQNYSSGPTIINDFNGNISIVHMYTRALTATEVAQNYRTHKGRFGR